MNDQHQEEIHDRLDTLIDGIDRQFVWRWGIGAPEAVSFVGTDDSLQYQCGAKAANELDALIARWTVDCSPVSFDIALPLGRAVIR
jgi:hypothetical protein